MITMNLAEFLLLESIKKAVAKLSSGECLCTQILIEGYKDKILLTTHNIENKTSSQGFKAEKITAEVFAVIPKSLFLLKN